MKIKLTKEQEKQISEVVKRYMRIKRKVFVKKLLRGQII